MSIDGKQILDYSITFNKNPWLIEYLKNTNIYGVLEAGDTQFNELENVFFELYLNIWLSTATGQQLDVLGVILDFARQGRDDESYRALLYTKININISSGEPESVISAARLIFGTENIEYRPEYPAKFRLWIGGNLGITNVYELVDDLGNNIVDDLGNNIILNISDYNALSVFLGLIPAGVGMLFADNLIDNNGNLIVTNDGYEIAVTYFIV